MVIRDLYRRTVLRLRGGVPQTGSLGLSLGPAPIEPSSILEGNPVAQIGVIATTKDGDLSCGVWECSAGTFRWFFALDEIVHILEGEVFVTVGEREMQLGVNDVALFPMGTHSVWRVPDRVRKFYTLRALPRMEQRLRGY